MLVAATAIADEVAATLEEEAIATAVEDVVTAAWEVETEAAADPAPLAISAEMGVLPGKKEVGMVGIGMLAVKAKGVAKSWAMVEAS